MHRSLWCFKFRVLTLAIAQRTARCGALNLGFSTHYCTNADVRTCTYEDGRGRIMGFKRTDVYSRVRVSKLRFSETIDCYKCCPKTVTTTLGLEGYE